MNKNNEQIKQKLKGLRMAGRIENWKVHEVWDQRILTGNVYGDSRWMEGEMITTSSVSEINEVEGYAVTKHSFYELGQKSNFG